MIYRFGPYSLNDEHLELLSDGEMLTVEPQVFSRLVFLIENRDRVVGKDELIEAVWDGRIVSDGTLNTRINAARRALGDDGKAQAVIKTFPRRGFRFVADVTEEGDRNPPSTPEIPLSDKPSIAVLPFVNLSSDPEQSYFSNGIAEDIITALARFRGLRVVARNSSFSYAEQPQDIRGVAQELNVRYVLEGSVRKSGNRVRISTQLVDGLTSEHIWAERHDRELDDIFALQDEITETVVGALEPEVSKAEIERARSKRPESLDAWDYYLRGLSHRFIFTEKGIAEAQRLFLRAIELDPGFAAAHAGLSEAISIEVPLGYTDRPAETLEKALQAARQAIALDNDDPAAHMALGRAHLFGNNVEAAIPEFKTALELNPNLAQARHQLGHALTYSGHAEEAVKHIEMAIRISPRDNLMGAMTARAAEAHLALGQYEKALDWARLAVRQPNIQWPGYAVLAAILGHLGRNDEARIAGDEILRRKPDLTLAWMTERWSPVLSNAELLELYIDGLRKAGLPEE